MTFVDIALARRLEAAEEIGGVRFAEALAPAHPELGVAIEEIGGGTAVFAGAGSPMTHIIGIGLDGPVTAADLDRVEQFYFSRGSLVEIVVCPLADPSLIQEIGKRPYRVTEFNYVYFRELGREERFGNPPDGIRLEPVTPPTAALYSEVVGSGFLDEQGKPVLPPDMFVPFAQAPGSICLLAYLGGKPVGGGGGMVLKEHRVAALFGASTLQEYRGRGIQSALLQRRLELGRDAGCDIAVVVTLPGTTSQRNAQRAGFTLAYTKIAVQRALPK